MRIPQAAHVRFRLIGASSKAADYGYIEATTRNISEGGVFIELRQQERLRDDAIGNYMLFKSTLDMEISLGGGAPLRAKGKVVWIEKKIPGQEHRYARGVAVQFTEISPQDAAAIREVISSALAQR